MQIHLAAACIVTMFRIFLPEIFDMMQGVPKNQTDNPRSGFALKCYILSDSTKMGCQQRPYASGCKGYATSSVQSSTGGSFITNTYSIGYERLSRYW